MTSPPRIFAHHMLREIYEQPAAVRDTFRHALLQPARFAATVATALASVRRVLIAASGTSRHAGIAGKFMLETLAGIPVEVDYSSELQHAPLPPGTDTLVVVITQSGETADTLAALRWARAGGAKVLAICNVADASVMREADAAIHTKAGPELAVPSTKAFTAQMAALLSFAMWLGAVRQPASLAAIERLRSEIELLPAVLETVLALDKTMHGLAARYAWCTDFFFAGRGVHHAVAMDGALKLKEVAYLHAEEFPTGEILHGPLALVDGKVVAFVIATRDLTQPGSMQRYEKTISNMRTFKSRSGTVIALAHEGDETVRTVADEVVPISRAAELLLPILEIVPLQLFAYHLATLLGKEVDRPRSLSKAVITD